MPEPIRAPHKEWDAVYHAAAQLDPLACCLVELCDRVVALEAAGDVAKNSGHASAAPAGGVTEEELADCLSANVVVWPYWYNQRAFARHLLDHPRIGPLLRGEGTAAPVRVVLPERPPLPEHPTPGLTGGIYLNGYAYGWAAARAEVERQQQGGQADG